jgi:hypothetical protein
MQKAKLPLVGEIERAFATINAKLFGGNLKMPPVVIDITKKVSIRYLSENLVVGSEFKGVDYHDLLLILLHEMVHVSNHQQGVVDCTANQYHNKKFLAAALAVGLVVKKHKTQGWSVTGLNIPKGGADQAEIRVPEKSAIQKRVKTFNEINIDRQIFREGKNYIAGKGRPAKACFLKYVCKCPPPHNSIRSGRRPDGPNPLRIRCEVCGSPFVFVG